MTNYLKFTRYLLVIVGFFGLAHAGSYEDFFAAIKRDQAPVVQDLLRRGFDPNTISPEGHHPLYLALREPSMKVADVLLASGQLKVEARNKADESALMMAALKGHTEFARRLIERGAHVNKPGWTPLHYAATGGHLAIMEMLLRQKALLDAQSPNGTTPLMMAAMYGTPEAVKLLLEAGADLQLRNQLGMTALDFAVQANRKDSAGLIQQQLDRRRPSGRW
jgi:uncharacterized protein